MLKASILLLSFNQERFIEDALLSALNQDYPELEILIGDDASTDDTRAIIERVLDAHPRARIARLFPPSANLGLIANWERLVSAATGDIIVAQAGDDISLPQRTARVAEIFMHHEDAAAVMSQVRIIDSGAKVLYDAYEKERPYFSKYQRSALRSGFNFWCGAPVIGACAAYRRQLAEIFGPMKMATSEDEAYIYRALLLGSVAYTDEVLLEWRWHGGNMSFGSLTEEHPSEIALERRAKAFLSRQKGCGQHLADLHVAYNKGIISRDAYNIEAEVIKAVSAIQGLGYATLSPHIKFGQWCDSAWEMLKAERRNLRCWSYLLRSCAKRLLPQSMKLKYSRHVR